MGRYSYLSSYGGFVTDNLQTYEELKAEVEEKERKERRTFGIIMTALVAPPLLLMSAFVGWLLIVAVVSSCS
jgi:hypothetical protein